MWIDAMLSMLVEIEKTRRGRAETTVARELLHFMDEERILTLAMLTDAADEALALTRYYDSPTSDPAKAHQLHQEFLNRIEFLFVQGRCIDFGFTQYALEWLNTSHAFLFSDCLKTLGGTAMPGGPEAVVARCLQRMVPWVWLAVATVQAEFPEWSYLKCFSFFDLDVVNPTMAASTHIKEQMQRCAGVTKCCYENLLAEWAEAVPVASSIKVAGLGLSSASAWRRALQRLRRRSPNQPFRTGALDTALSHYLASEGCGTGGVERVFSVGETAVQY